MENRLPIRSIQQRFVMVAAVLHDFCQERQSAVMLWAMGGNGRARGRL